jgi:hypothetical protein
MNKALAEDVPSEERPRLEAACEEADRQIDRPIYGLSGLTEDEMRIV